MHLSALFPLTPALSLRERGNSLQPVDKPGAIGCRKTVKVNSLSLRERAGVRGKGVFVDPVLPQSEGKTF
jgi:hypothetical protein